MDEVVFIKGEFAIIKCIRIFCTGFNCYKSDGRMPEKFTKINRINSWFNSYDAAITWLDKYIEANKEINRT